MSVAPNVSYVPCVAVYTGVTAVDFAMAVAVYSLLLPPAATSHPRYEQVARIAGVAALAGSIAIAALSHQDYPVVVPCGWGPPEMGEMNIIPSTVNISFSDVSRHEASFPQSLSIVVPNAPPTASTSQSATSTTETAIISFSASHEAAFLKSLSIVRSDAPPTAGTISRDDAAMLTPFAISLQFGTPRQGDYWSLASTSDIKVSDVFVIGPASVVESSTSGQGDSSAGKSLSIVRFDAPPMAGSISRDDAAMLTSLVISFQQGDPCSLASTSDTMVSKHEASFSTSLAIIASGSTLDISASRLAKTMSSLGEVGDVYAPGLSDDALAIGGSDLPGDASDDILVGQAGISSTGLFHVNDTAAGPPPSSSTTPCIDDNYDNLREPLLSWVSIFVAIAVLAGLRTAFRHRGVRTAKRPSAFVEGHQDANDGLTSFGTAVIDQLKSGLYFVIELVIVSMIAILSTLVRWPLAIIATLDKIAVCYEERLFIETMIASPVDVQIGVEAAGAVTALVDVDIIDVSQAALLEQDGTVTPSLADVGVEDTNVLAAVLEAVIGEGKVDATLEGAGLSSSAPSLSPGLNSQNAEVVTGIPSFFSDHHVPFGLYNKQPGPTGSASGTNPNAPAFQPRTATSSDDAQPSAIPVFVGRGPPGRRRRPRARRRQENDGPNDGSKN